MKHVYTVAQVNTYIKNMFTQDFMLNRIYVKGEVSNCKYHSSGHIYFSLKDESGSMACVMFAGDRKGLAFPMKDGQRVIVLGRVSVYERSGSYQLYAREIIKDGVGQLYEAYEKLKMELEEMGMFAPEYKQPIPYYAKKVGVVTAPTGAAVQDIRNIALRRNPYVQLILYPAQVQGEGAADSIVRGIETLDALGLDVLIVGRGGGSIEDLWAFNEEKVARAIFDCNTPVISAVGHETDTTIADYVADLRAPTPSAAAELAVADIRELLERMRGYQQQFENIFRHRMEEYYRRLAELKSRVQRVSPETQLLEKRMRLAELSNGLEQAMQNKLSDRKHSLNLYIERLHGLSPLLKLQQGYSYTEGPNGKAVTGIDEVTEGERLRIHVTDGVYTAVVEGREKIKKRI
ncbi:exodeoxyribonuclease VII large subunit [Laedolimicola ammoniilytica]|uniref:Exodeoxyribonuclease 7 large subunit n=1 Tax=Laedolimicola ammoniilytica TaxID=2981771 RepID=A0ABT2RZF9_9FIRM|nr:exodeoxyribonuclease VII large subunit [Laedolimicola ammoniilytica]MCU6697715.1 exodeoxyribonuclease VII large subunit [Laedolimicola ammoniilytica]SCI42298.1 Exodeoxyribonuclease 7 large subunit [uncultured Clostridium sp.]